MKKIIAINKYEAAGTFAKLNSDVMGELLSYFDLEMLAAANVSCRLLQESVQKTPGYKMFKFLDRLGIIYPVKFSNGRETIACIITYEGIKGILEVKDADGLSKIFGIAKII